MLLIKKIEKRLKETFAIGIIDKKKHPLQSGCIPRGKLAHKEPPPLLADRGGIFICAVFSRRESQATLLPAYQAISASRLFLT